MRSTAARLDQEGASKRVQFEVPPMRPRCPLRAESPLSQTGLVIAPTSGRGGDRRSRPAGSARFFALTSLGVQALGSSYPETRDGLFACYDDRRGR